MEKEIWKDLPDYNGVYQVSNLGRVKSFKWKKEGSLLKLQTNNVGYVYFSANKNNKKKIFKVHIVVCELFNGTKPTEKHQVNHIDGDKSNNNADNLEWNTPAKNTQHALNSGLKKSNTTKKKSVVQKTLNGEIINIYPSIRAAAKAVAGNPYGVSLACNKKLLTFKGFVWDFYD